MAINDSMGNTFIILENIMASGVYMRFTVALIIVFMSSLLVISCNAQLTNQFQSVGGDFGKTWISNFLAQNRPTTSTTNENLKNDLWSWGNKPKGKTLVNGKLVDSTNSTTKVNYSANWLGDRPIGRPIYFNSSSPYGNYGLNPDNANLVNPAPLTPMALSDDPWILAQQLELPVMAPVGYYPFTYT